MMWSVVFWTFVLGLARGAEAGPMGDQCDWSGRYVGGTFLFFCTELLCHKKVFTVCFIR